MRTNARSPGSSPKGMTPGLRFYCWAQNPGSWLLRGPKANTNSLYFFFFV